MFIYFIILTISSFGQSSYVVNRYDDCQIDKNIINEIKSYKNVIDHIMDEMKTKYGDQMYEEYNNFIDNFGPRLSGSDVLEKSIDHMINLTKSNGVSDVFTEDVDVPHWTRLHEKAVLLQPRHKEIGILGFGYSVSTPPGGITAEVIVVKSFDELEKIDNSKVKGKIVVFDQEYVSYGETVVYRSKGASKAGKKGAVAALIRSITPFSLYTLHTGMQSYDSNVPKIPSAAITPEDAELLRRFQNTGHTISLHLEMNYNLNYKVSRNTIVDQKGKVNPDNYVIVSGHIDSWDVGQGAMDDGGGMFISWFVPVILKKLQLQPKRTVRAILWTAEEMGLVGAASYLNKHMNELNKINFIMESDEGTFKPLGLDVGGTKGAQCIIAEILKQFSPIDKITASGYPGSDIVLFVKKGVPGGSLLNKNERYFWYHHSKADMMNVQSKEDVIECAAFWAALSYVIADLSVDIPR